MVAPKSTPVLQPSSTLSLCSHGILHRVEEVPVLDMYLVWSNFESNLRCMTGVLPEIECLEYLTFTAAL